MTPEMFGATLRALMQMAVGYAAAAGMAPELYQQVTLAVVGLATWGWSVAQKKAAKKLETAKAAPAK